MSGDRGILPLGATDPNGQAAYSRVYNTPWGGQRQPQQGDYFGSTMAIDPPPPPRQPSGSGDPVLPQAGGGGAADLMVPRLYGAKEGTSSGVGFDWSDETLQFRTGVSEMLQDIQAHDPGLLYQVGIEGPAGAFRTHEQQRQARADFEAGKISRAALPGHSLHEQGLAADWKFASPEARAKFVKFAEQHGFVFPFDDDTGHMQLAGNPRLAAMMASDRSGMWNIMQRVESSNGTDLSQTQTSSGPAQGINQITTETWRDFAPNAGIDLTKYPTAQSVVDAPNLSPQSKVAIQNLVAAGIPLGRWDAKTVKAIEDVYGPQDHSKKFGELAGGLPQGQNIAGGTDYGSQEFQRRNKDIDRIQEGLGALIKKMNETDPNDPEMRNLLRQHRERADQLEQAMLDRAFHAPERTQTDIMSQFGSLAMMAAVFGGFAARVPAVASLNAAGAAMEAQAANNDRDYQDRMEVWKLQTAALGKAYAMERDQIQDIMDDRKSSLAERHQKLEEAYQMLGLDRELASLRAGNYEALQRDQEYRRKVAKDLEELPRIHAETRRAEAEARKAAAEAANLEGLSGWSPDLRGNDAATRRARAYIEAEHARLVAAHEATTGKTPEVAPAAGGEPVPEGRPATPPEIRPATDRPGETTAPIPPASAAEPAPAAPTAAPTPAQAAGPPPSLEEMKKDPYWVEKALAHGGAERISQPKPYTITSPDGKTEHVNLATRDGKWWDVDKGQPWVKPAGYSDPVPAPASTGRIATAQSNSMVAAGNFATAALENLTELPGPASTGWFMGTEAHPPGDLSGWKRVLAHKFTSAEDRAMQESAAGVQREMATLEAQGRATGIVGLTTVNQVLIPQKEDTVFDRMRKFSEIRLVVEKNMETLEHQGNLNPVQQKFVEDIKSRVQIVWPYTVHDVNELQWAAPKTAGGFGGGFDEKTIKAVANRVADQYRGAQAKEAELFKNAPVVSQEQYKIMPRNSLYRTSPGGKVWRKLDEPEGGGPMALPPGTRQATTEPETPEPVQP